MVREIVDKIVNQAHMVVGINTGKLYPVTDEDLVIREIGSKV
jgi:Tfp pilus assembly protein PilP